MRWAWEEGLGDADLLLEAFPCAKVVLSYREQVEGQARSAWHANATPVHKLAMENAELDGFKRRHEGATFRLPSERFSTAAVDELFAWLGFPHCHALYLIRANENGRDTGHFEPKPASAVRCDEEKG